MGAGIGVGAASAGVFGNLASQLFSPMNGNQSQQNQSRFLCFTSADCIIPDKRNGFNDRINPYTSKLQMMFHKFAKAF